MLKQITRRHYFGIPAVTFAYPICVVWPIFYATNMREFLGNETGESLTCYIVNWSWHITIQKEC